MKSIFLGSLIALVISYILYITTPSIFADLSYCEKSEINKVCIENKDNPKVQELLNAVKDYQKAGETDRDGCKEKVTLLLKSLLEIEPNGESR